MNINILKKQFKYLYHNILIYLHFQFDAFFGLNFFFFSPRPFFNTIKFFPQITIHMQIRIFYRQKFDYLKHSMSATVSQFVHSSDFWRWHGFVLSGLWLFGSTVSSVMKQSKMKYYHIPHLIVDYVSFIFMAISVYLMVPQLHLLMKGSNMQIIHVVGGLIFFGLLLYQHFKGIKGWSPDYKVSSNLILFGRILAATGWLIHEEDKMYALGVLGISVLLYTMVERKPELMTKGK